MADSIVTMIIEHEGEEQYVFDFKGPYVAYNVGDTFYMYKEKLEEPLKIHIMAPWKIKCVY